MTGLFLALLATLSVSVPSPTEGLTQSVPVAHAAHIRRMLQSDGLGATIDANLPALQSSLKRAAAKARGEAELTPEEAARFETISQPVMNRLKQQLFDYAVQDYASLNDADIDALIKANETSLAKRFIARIVGSEAADRSTVASYVSETATEISTAYAQNRPYAPRYNAPNASVDDTPENRLLVVTGNAAMCDEVIQNHYIYAVAGEITDIEFDKLGNGDATRLRGMFQVGMEDLGNRLKALKRNEYHFAFSKEELDQLIALYSFPAVQTKIRIAQATIPAGRTRNQAAIKASFDEVLAAFAEPPTSN